MVKGRLIGLVVLFLVFSSFFVSADLRVREEIDKSYTTDVETISYKEDLYGHNKGFTLTITSKSPKYKYEYEDEYPYVTWGYIQPTSYRYGDYGYTPSYNYNNRYNYYNLEPVLYTYRTGRDDYRGKSYGYSGYLGYGYSGYGGYGGYSGYRRNYW